MKLTIGAAAIMAVMAATPVRAVPTFPQLGPGAVDIARSCHVKKNKTPQNIVDYCTRVIVSTTWYGQAWPYFQRALAYIDLGQRESALADLDMAVKLSHEDDTNLPGEYHERCILRAEAGKDMQGALDDCSKSLALRPGDARTRGTRAMIEYRMANYSAVISDCDSALEWDPSAYSCLYLRGLAKLTIGDSAGGNGDIETAKKNNPSLAKIYAGWGMSP
jgi:tetratricopeptide (TPR) repeat protein